MAKRSGSVRQMREVVANGKTYQSITEFCNAHGLKYPSVAAQLRKGIPPETIIENHGVLPTTTRYKAGSRIAIPCSYDGVEYPSITAAADALGLPAHRIPACMKRRKCSASDAIKYLMEEADDEQFNITVDSTGPRIPCVVEGVLYPSRSAACKAYGVRYVTVHSRMEREDLSFEDALASGGVNRRHIQPMNVLWGDLNLIEFTPNDPGDALSQILNIIIKTGQDAHCFYDSSQKIGAVKVHAPLHAISDYKDIYILIPYPVSSSVIDIELMLPNLCHCKITSAKKRLEILEFLCSVNAKYSGACLNLFNTQLRVSSALSLVSAHINNRIILRSFQRFLGTAAAMYDDCVATLDVLV